jgi:hypothetical protein
MTLKVQVEAAKKVIKQLRKRKLSEGHPFMINSDVLEKGQCYMEYPDGSIKIVEADMKHKEFYVVYELSENDANDIRRKHKLL